MPLGRRELLHVLLGAAAWATAATAAAGCSSTDDGTGDATDREDHDMTDTPAGRARDAFLAGFPLVTTARTMQTFADLIGVNRLFVTPGLVDPRSHLVVGPNRDTVYALAVVDLRAGPQVLSLPAIPDRYHVVQFLDAWMGGFGLVGTRTTGGRAGSWAIVPPDHDGPLPEGAGRLECPTDQAFVLARIRAVDDADAADAVAVGRRIELRPLPPPRRDDRAAERAEPPTLPPPPGRPEETGANGAAFFDELGDALAVNRPVTPEQRAAIDGAAALGVGPGRHPAADGNEEDVAVLERAVADGLRELERQEGVPVRVVNGWAVNLNLGTPETDRGLKERAIVARYFWGPVPAEEAVYPRAVADADGRPLDGARRYRIRFPAGGLPPVEAFWSLTVYGPDMFLVPNPAGRYSLSGDTPGLVTNADGSLDVLLQREPPAGREANWLPVPDGPFNLIMRLYLPGEAVVDGTYEYPPVTPID
ncbi:MAG TPA: DUF1214 domain-containing protein [Acidimicrobiales bacterium]